MGIFKRVAKIAESEMNDRKERRERDADPNVQVAALFQQMVGKVAEVKRLLGEVAFAHQKLQREIANVKTRMEELENEARDALARGDEERARELLVKRRHQADRLVEMEARERTLRKQLEHLQDSYDELREQADSFEEKRDESQARMAAASAKLALKKASDAVSFDVDRALESAEEQARIAEARAEVAESIEQQLARLEQESKKAP